MPLTLKKYKNRPNWIIRGTYKGEQVFQTSGTPNRGLAEKELENTCAEIEAGTFHRNRKDCTFGEAAESYREAGGSSRYLGKFDEETGQWTGVLGRFVETPLSKINQARLDEEARRAYPNVQPETLNRHFYTPFVAVWNHAASKELCEERKWKRPKRDRAAPPKKRRAWLRNAETAGQLLYALPSHLMGLYLFYLYTGARITEGIEIQIEDVFLADKWAVLNATKTDAFRGVPLHPILLKVLPWVIGDRKTGPVFLNHVGQPYKTRRASDRTVQGSGYFKNAWQTGLDRADLSDSGLTPYSLRHTFNNWLIRAGVEKEDREALMGHTDSSTNATYSDVPHETYIEIVSKLPDCTDFAHFPTLNPSMFTLSFSENYFAKWARKNRKSRANKKLNK